ncbi:MAG: hypothetical protein ACRD0C_15865 [Acidimicrobiia bacterium]
MSTKPEEPIASDQEFILDLFDEGLVPINVAHDAAVPDSSFYDEVVYE